MKQFSLILLAVLATPTWGWASLGDGSERIDDAYGNLVQRHLHDDGTLSVLYHKDRYLFQVVFDNGRSVSETYFHANGTDLSEKEITAFLKANAAPKATWTPGKSAKERRFTRNDGKAEATYGNVNGLPGLTVREVRAKP